MVISLNSYLLDTNTVLYLLGDQLKKPLEEGKYLISVITEIELLSYPSLSTKEESEIKSFLTDIEIIGLNKKVVESTILFRKTHKIKMPDAIIAATALEKLVPLITNDPGFYKITEIKTIKPAI